jgi:hypothetical protein
MLEMIAVAMSAWLIGAPQTDPTPVAQPASTAAPADKKICRRITPTGTMLPRRFCLTKTEWTELHRRNAEDADSSLSRRVNIAAPDTDKLK